jgi:hypothetical protein
VEGTIWTFDLYMRDPGKDTFTISFINKYMQEEALNIEFDIA